MRFACVLVRDRAATGFHHGPSPTTTWRAEPAVSVGRAASSALVQWANQNKLAEIRRKVGQPREKPFFAVSSFEHAATLPEALPP